MSETNPRTKCYHCEREIIHSKLFRHLCYAHSPDFWTPNNKRMIQKAINKEGFSDIPLELKGYDVFYYFSPYSKRLYTKLTSAKKDVEKYQGNEKAYKTSLQAILEAANGVFIPPAPQAQQTQQTQQTQQQKPQVLTTQLHASSDSDEVLALKKMLVILAKELMFELQEKQEKDDLIATYTAALIDKGMSEEEVNDMAPVFSNPPEVFDFKTHCMTKKHVKYLSYDITDFKAVENAAYSTTPPTLPGKK